MYISKPRFNTVVVVIAVMTASLMMAVFFGMALDLGGVYKSDSPAHISTGVLLKGYGLEALFVFVMGKITTYPLLQLLFALYETVLVMLTWGISYRFIERQYKLDKRISLLISFCLLFLTAIYIPVLYPWFYKYGLGTQPWHNSTYYGMRLFGVLNRFDCQGQILDRSGRNSDKPGLDLDRPGL